MPVHWSAKLNSLPDLSIPDLPLVVTDKPTMVKSPGKAQAQSKSKTSYIDEIGLCDSFSSAGIQIQNCVAMLRFH